MPDYTVKADVDSMLRADNDAGIRSAIGLGQTDAPTFLNFTATGASSSAPRFAVTSDFLIVPNGSNVGIAFFGGPFLSGTGTTDSVQLRNNGGTAVVRLAVDSNEILAQRNGEVSQALRVYNTFPGSGNHEWGGFDWKTTTNTLRIGTEKAASGGLRPVWFVSSSDLFRFNNSNTYSQDTVIFVIGQSGYSSQFIQTVNATSTGWIPNTLNLRLDTADEGFVIRDGGTNFRFGFSRGGLFRLGGITDAFPAIARDGAGIKITGAAAGSTSWIKVPAVAVSALPSAATAGVGARSFVNDALAPVFGSAVASGGTVNVPVYSNGTNWFVG